MSLPLLISSCGSDDGDEPNQTDNPNDEFADLYGYWINANESGAMEIKKTSGNYCDITYYANTASGVKSRSSAYYGSWSSINVLSPDGTKLGTATISSRTPSKILLKDGNGVLSSTVFSCVSEDKFFKFFENGGNSNDPVTPDNPGNDDDDQKLLGSWVGHDYDETYTITFYSSGRAVEEWTDGDETVRTAGTYKYSKGQITEWDMEDGSILANVINDVPWNVTFESSTKMVLKSVYSSERMTFNKK